MIEERARVLFGELGNVLVWRLAVDTGHLWHADKRNISVRIRGKGDAVAYRPPPID